VAGNFILTDQNSGDNFGIELGGTGWKTLAYNHVGPSPQIPSTDGPVIGYSVSGSNITGYGLSEDSCSDGIRVRDDVTNVELSGSFPDGILFNADVTTPGAVIVDGHVGSIDESVTGWGAGQVINGRSWVNTTPGTGSIWDEYADKAYRLGVTIEDRSVPAPYDQYKADSAGNWVQIV
jgi:hypothetical protein